VFEKQIGHNSTALAKLSGGGRDNVLLAHQNRTLIDIGLLEKASEEWVIHVDNLTQLVQAERSGFSDLALPKLLEPFLLLWKSFNQIDGMISRSGDKELRGSELIEQLWNYRENRASIIRHLQSAFVTMLKPQTENTKKLYWPTEPAPELPDVTKDRPYYGDEFAFLRRSAFHYSEDGGSFEFFKVMVFSCRVFSFFPFLSSSHRYTHIYVCLYIYIYIYIYIYTYVCVCVYCIY
jgi:hypothetical protein